MPLPQQVIEQLNREPVRTPGWSWQMLLFSSTVFFISLATYFGLVYGYQPYLNGTVEQLKQDEKRFAKAISDEDQKNLILFYSQLDHMKTILDRHVISSALFDWLEKNTQANIAFSRFGLNSGNGQLTLSGTARDVADLVQQLQIFQDASSVDRISVGNVTVAQTGGWQFDITLFLKPESLRGSTTAR